MERHLPLRRSLRARRSSPNARVLAAPRRRATRTTSGTSSSRRTPRRRPRRASRARLAARSAGRERSCRRWRARRASSTGSRSSLFGDAVVVAERVDARAAHRRRRGQRPVRVIPPCAAAPAEPSVESVQRAMRATGSASATRVVLYPGDYEVSPARPRSRDAVEGARAAGPGRRSSSSHAAQKTAKSGGRARAVDGAALAARA